MLMKIFGLYNVRDRKPALVHFFFCLCIAILCDYHGILWASNFGDYTFHLHNLFAVLHMLIVYVTPIVNLIVFGFLNKFDYVVWNENMTRELSKLNIYVMHDTTAIKVSSYLCVFVLFAVSEAVLYVYGLVYIYDFLPFPTVELYCIIPVLDYLRIISLTVNFHRLVTRQIVLSKQLNIVNSRDDGCWSLYLRERTVPAEWRLRKLKKLHKKVLHVCYAVIPREYGYSVFLLVVNYAFSFVHDVWLYLPWSANIHALILSCIRSAFKFAFLFVFFAFGEYNCFKTPQFIVLWVLFILIVVGNSSVLITLLKQKGRKSRMNFFIMHLAIADLLVGLVNVLVDIMWRITITWHAGNLGCKIIRYLQVVVTYSSTYVLVALSIDRYDAITRPMKFSGSWRRAKFLVCTAWGLSVVFSLPIPVLYEEKEIGGRAQCWLDFPEQWQWRVYMTVVACAVFIIPALIIIICYTVIVCTIWSKSSTIVMINPQQRRKSTRGSTIQPRVRKYPEEYESRRASSRGLIPRAKIKTIKMTFVIVFVFIICWSPYFIFDLLQVYDYIPETQTTVAVATFIQSLAPLNSAANPVIYCLFSTRTCSMLWKLPPFKWIVSWLSTCFPGLAEGSKRRFNRGCLRYGENSTTMTETITQSSKRSRLTSGTSLRQIVMFKVNSADTHNKNYGKAEVTVV